MSLCFDVTLRWSTRSIRRFTITIELTNESDTHLKQPMMSRKEGLKSKKKNGFEPLPHQGQRLHLGCKSQHHPLESMLLVRE
jgi:hypothetical protein